VYFVTVWLEAHPGGTVIHRELGLTPLPQVSEDWIAAAFCNPADRTPEQREAIAISDALIDELLLSQLAAISRWLTL
jgi:FMN-dependent NADH-azoreductase